MTEFDIISKIMNEGETLYDSLTSDNDKDSTKDIIVSLLTRKILKSKVNENTMEIVLYVGNKTKAKAIIKLHELDEKLGYNGLRLIVLSNKDDLECKPGNSCYKSLIIELNIAENSDKKFTILDENGDQIFNDWFDNICIVSYQSHPCYPENTKFGIVVEKNHEFAGVVSKGEPMPVLRKNILPLLKKGASMLTVFTYRQFLFKYDNGEDIYQGFWGYKRSWLLGERELMVKHDDKLSYYEDIMANSNTMLPFGSHKLEKGDYFMPRYIIYDKKRRFYTYTQYQFEEFIREYEVNKKEGKLKKYQEHYSI